MLGNIDGHSGHTSASFLVDGLRRPEEGRPSAEGSSACGRRDWDQDGPGLPAGDGEREAFEAVGGI